MRFEDPPQVGHPESLVPPGAQRGPDGVLKHFIHPEEGEDTGLEVRHSHLPCCRPPYHGNGSLAISDSSFINADLGPASRCLSPGLA